MPPIPVARMHPRRIGSYGRSPSQPASSIASAAATTASCEKRSSRRISLTVSSSLGSKSVHAPAPSKIPHSPAAQREYSASAPTPSGVTAPRPVITTLRRMGRSLESASLTRAPASLRAADDQVDRVADGLELLHVLALEHDAVVVLDDLRELDQVERVDVELLERRTATDLV